MSKTRDRLRQLELRAEALEGALADPLAASDQRRLAQLGREHNELEETIGVARRLVDAETRIEQAREILRTEADEEMRELAEADLAEGEALVESLTTELQERLLPRDPLDDRNLLLEIRAGTGGDEAGLFAADLLRMYCRYAETQGWKTEVVAETASELGGFREVVVMIRGERVYSRLKFEGGVHRVQRVPVTESQGRIHTSAATVAVMPEAEETDIVIHDADLKIDTFRASGAGGQHVNKTESAVRFTHIPTGLVVQCQDERSQHKNRLRALTILRARLLEHKIAEEAKTRSATRKAMVGSGDRSERIRTYNFPQNRLTDHRINLTLYSLDRVMEGAMDELLSELKKHELAERLKELGQ